MVIIIPYFNLTGNARQRKNHILCVKRMMNCGYTVITAEAVLEGAPRSSCDPNVNRNHLHYTWYTGTCIWHKEQLINLAWERYSRENPGAACKLLWLDSGCYLKRGVVQAVERALDGYDTVQCFSHVHSLLPDGRTLDKQGWGRGTHPGWMLRESTNHNNKSGSHGGAWAATAAFFKDIGGLYDRMVMGGGDTVYLMGALRRTIMDPAWPVDTDLYAHEEAYAKRVWSLNPESGYVDGVLHHLWHTTNKLRYVQKRNAILALDIFNPAEDLEPDEGGLYRWTESARQDLREAVASYILSRVPPRDVGAVTSTM